MERDVDTYLIHGDIEKVGEGEVDSSGDSFQLRTERACNRYASVRARDVSFCKIGGELFGDCLDYLPLEIPIDPPR